MLNSQRESGIAIILFLILSTIILILMAGCKTRETLTEIVTVHDTLREVRTDTVRDVRVVTQRDSTHHETERIVTIRENGDTLRIINNNTIERIIQRTDSIDRYRYVADSLRQALISEQQKNKVVKKSGPPVIDKLIFLIILIAIIYIIFRFIFRKKG